MFLKSLQGCQLAIGRYPTFYYDARGGGGEANLLQSESRHLQKIRFNPNTFHIPPLNWKTTKILGLPMPPGLEIKMFLDTLQGTIEMSTGEIKLDFESRFVFTMFPSFYFPDLIVKTCLTSGKAKSGLHFAKGKPLQKDGSTKLVGIAVIPPSGNLFLDTFLDLPNEALAILQCKIN